MTMPTIAFLIFAALFLAAVFGSLNRKWVYVCPKCGFTALPRGELLPKACPNKDRMKVMFPGAGYALMCFGGEIAACILVVHFVIQRFVPSLSPYWAWLVVLATIQSFREAVKIPALVQNLSHRSRVRSHYWGSVVGHLLSLPVILVILRLRTL